VLWKILLKIIEQSVKFFWYHFAIPEHLVSGPYYANKPILMTLKADVTKANKIRVVFIII